VHTSVFCVVRSVARVSDPCRVCFGDLVLSSLRSWTPGGCCKALVEVVRIPCSWYQVVA